MSRVKVTAIPGGYSFEGVSYGPFEADKKTPFVEVPEALASALTLPLHEDEVKAREAAQAEQEADGESADTFDPVKALERVSAELPTLSAEMTAQLAPIVAALDEALKANTDAVNANTATLQQAPAPQSPEQGDTLTPKETANPIDQTGRTPLVDGLPLHDLLTGNGFDTMERLEAGLKVLEGTEQSPVQAIDGIGKKTVEAYTKAVADWRKGQGRQ